MLVAASMGAGASSEKRLTLKEARQDEKDAKRLFDHIDKGGVGLNESDGKITAVEIFTAVTDNHLEWNPLEIKNAIELFDKDGYGCLDREEFKAALKQMHDKGQHDSRLMRRGFTFKRKRQFHQGKVADAGVDDAIANARAAREKALEEAKESLAQRRAAAGLND